jgi:hypothetical protein
MRRNSEYKPSSSLRWPFSAGQTLALGLLSLVLLWCLGSIIVSALALSGVGIPTGVMLAFMLTSHLSATQAIVGLVTNSLLTLFVAGYTAYLANKIYHDNKLTGYYDNHRYSTLVDPVQSDSHLPAAITSKQTPSSKFTLLDRLRGCCGSEPTVNESTDPLLSAQPTVSAAS